MPLIHGYTPKSIRTNVSREVARGKPGPQAVAIALEEARRAWRHAHPKGPYPAHLRGMRKVRRSTNRTHGRLVWLVEIQNDRDTYFERKGDAESVVRAARRRDESASMRHVHEPVGLRWMRAPGISGRVANG